MIVPKPHVLAQNPHTDIYAHLWSNLDDSSPIAVTLTQTMHNVANCHILHQIGQLGINATIVALVTLFVFVDGMYREVEDSTYPFKSDEIGQEG